MIKLDLVGKSFGPSVFEYTWRDVILYHLGIGASARDLDFVFEGARDGLQVIPTFGVIPAFEVLWGVVKNLNVDVQKVLHGEQTILADRPIPPQGKLLTTARLEGIYDKGKAALVQVRSETASEQGEVLFRCLAVFFCRGEGGWGGDPGPKGEPHEVLRDRPPDFAVADQTSPDQAVLYRLMGDVNPLHVDPQFAAGAGFKQPILHGLCTFGFAARAILKAVCDHDVRRLKEFKVRFSNVVFPGETLTTRGWKVKPGLYQVEAVTPGGVALSQAYARVAER
jgi:acyl dehydratase